MEFELKSEQDWLWIQLPAEVDHYQAERLREAVKKKMQEQYVKYVVFDFRNTQMMDSSGIGLVTGRYREMAARGGQVYVSHVSEKLQKLLTLSGIYRIVTPLEQVITTQT